MYEHYSNYAHALSSFSILVSTYIFHANSTLQRGNHQLLSANIF